MRLEHQRDHEYSARALGWLDGFCTTPNTSAGHIAVQVDETYALVWPGREQGDMAAVAQRLMQLGMAAETVPARLGQSIRSGAALPGGQVIARALKQFGASWQFSLMLPYTPPPLPPKDACLRTKHAGRKARSKALKTAASGVSGLISSLPVKALPPQQCGSRTLALHLLAPKHAASAVVARWQAALETVDYQGALIGPLPPFAFLQTGGAG